jgi:hypothetical protein
MTKSLFSAAILATFLPLCATAGVAVSPPVVELTPVVATQASGPSTLTVPADYSAWVQLPLEQLFALKPGTPLRFNLPGIGPLDLAFDGVHKLDATGRVLEWSGHRPGRDDDRVVLVRGLHGGLSGTLDIGGARLLLGQANGESLLYRAGVDAPSPIAERPQVLAPVELTAAHPEADKPAAVSFPVAVDLVGLSDVPVGGDTELTLPEVGTFTLVHDNTLAGDLGASTFVGYLKDYGDDFRVLITSSPTGSIGSILSPHGEFKLVTNNGQTWVVDVSRSGLRDMVPDHDDGVDHRADSGLEAAAMAGALPGPAEAGGVAAAAGATGAGGTTAATATATSGKTDIDVLVLYGPGLESRLGSAQALARIQHLVALANQSYVDSKVDINLRLVKAVKLDALADNNSNSQALSDLAAGRGVFAQVPALRQQYGADLVTVVRPFHLNGQGRNCGVGYIGGYGGRPISGYSAYGYSVVSDGTDVEGSRYYCTDYTFTHELGHNMGSMHDRATVTSQGGGSGAYPYSFGYGLSGQFGTIMSYISPVVGKFSNPNLATCGNGQACGVASSSSQAADNALSLNNTREGVAGYRQATGIQPLYISGLASLNGKPLTGVKVSGSGAKCGATASNGAYSCEVANGWSGTLVPALSGYTFTPKQLQYTQLTASKAQQNWKAIALPVTVSGTATLSGKPLAGVTVSGAGAICTGTAANGAYSCQVPNGWSGTLKVSKSGYGFSPSARAYSQVTSAKTQQNWGATVLRK